ncbi:GNVR domain-containing protein [Algoriphagus litoralis]|uniref:GNVR domain-containing protein n=1 Tax=Algoriphagus litoralis TaxID=2202829 RepID=UPI0013005C8C|nr:GNVR domain-containing protein [Algoriphagus litoralis]
MSGLNLGSINSGDQSSLSPQLYQEIVYSYPFLWKLSRQEVELGGKKIRLGEYVEENRRPSMTSLVKKYTIGLPSLFSQNQAAPIDLETEIPDSLIFSRRELVPLFNEYRKIISLENDPKTGVITLQTETLSPEISAQVAVYVYNILSEYVIEFKTEKAKHNVEFIESQFQKAQNKFVETQNKLSSFRDRNQNLNFSTARAQEERLQAEFTLASNLYTNLAVQLDQARIKYQEDIPQLTIINPPVVSYQTSKPNIPLIMAVSIFMGILLGATWVLILYLKMYLLKGE